ncbi:hypothetical protein RRF57_011304 [Xylaria bambusicola]|uniref:Uncharacterized protein n=1 Tax=Xylaria bambusicola TaxID=326684 RepID=A0AAN7UTK8_9PEZI
MVTTAEGYPSLFSYDALASLDPQFNAIICTLVNDGTKLCLDLKLGATCTQLSRVGALQDIEDKKVGNGAGYEINRLRAFNTRLPWERLPSKCQGAFSCDLIGLLPGQCD